MITDDKKVQSHYNKYSFDNFTQETISSLEQRSLFGFALKNYLKPCSASFDIGCGTGKLFALAEKFKFSSLIGIDISFKSLKVLKERWPNTSIINGSNLNLPIRDSVASLILSSGVIHHTSDPQASFKECVRVLSPNGIFCVSVYNREHRYYWVYKNVGRFFRGMASFVASRFLLKYLIIPLWYVYFCGLRSMITRGKLAKLSFKRSINLFYDRYMITQAFFFTTEEMIELGKQSGLCVIKHQELGAMLEFLFVKEVT